MATQSKDILFLRPDKAGDALKTLPVLRAVQRLHPEWKFHLLCSKYNASLFAFEPSLSTYELPNRWEQMPPEQALKSCHPTLPDSFSIAINLLCDPNPKVESLLNALSSARKYSIELGLRLPTGTPAKQQETLNIWHLVAQSLNIEPEPIDVTNNQPVLGQADTIEAARLGSKNRVEKWIGLCPFAGTHQRGHSPQVWKRVAIKLCRNSGYQFVFIFGGPSNKTQMEQMKSKNSEKLKLCFPSSFRTLGAYLLRMDAVIAVDSGPLHLARAFKIPSLGMLSGGDAERWFSPLNERDHLVRRGWWGRFPTYFEILRAYRLWEKQKLLHFSKQFE